MSKPDRQHPGQLWPSADYQRQVERLRSAVGRTVYLVELAASPITLGVRQTGEAHVLLDVIDFARPDPARGLAPHMIVLDDGRGINLGQLIRVSIDRAYGPSADQTLYLDRELQQQLLLRKRRLSRAFIARHARLLLGHVLGQTEPPPPPSLEADQDWRDRTALALPVSHKSRWTSSMCRATLCARGVAEPDQAEFEHAGGDRASACAARWGRGVAAHAGGRGGV